MSRLIYALFHHSDGRPSLGRGLFLLATVPVYVWLVVLWVVGK